MKNEGLKIIELHITNHKKVEAFKMTLDGGNLCIAGDVSSGKTTAVNALWEVLSKSSDSVTHGKRQSKIRIKLAGGDRIIIAERVTGKSSSVRISDEEGKPISAKDFKAMISTLAVNPHKIKDMPPTEQVKSLLRSAKVEVDLDTLDTEIAENEALRLEAHRDADREKPSGDRPAKVVKVSVADLLDQLAEAEGVNGQNAILRKAFDNLKVMKDEVAEQIEVAKNELAHLQGTYAKLAEDINTGTPINDAMEDINEAAIRGNLASAEETNEKAATYEAWMSAEHTYNNYLQAKETYNEVVKDLREKKTQALDKAEWPIEGLTVSDGNIYYKGSLLENLGESEQMLVCAALAMNDILAHDIRVVRMDGVESMSKEHQVALEELFNGHGIQVLSTRVARGDLEPNEIEIVDGEYVEETDSE